VATAARVVVCAIDGSASDGRAVDVATQLASLTKARLALVAIAPTPSSRNRDLDGPAWTLEEAKRALELNADVVDGVEVELYVDSGNPVRRLLELAEQKRALLLVVGTPGPRTGRPPSIVASGLSRGARCPVVVVPETASTPSLDALRQDE
jgi:nucleotide-binding universal stress UspA family protein